MSIRRLYNIRNHSARTKTEFKNVYEYDVSTNGRPARKLYCYSKIVKGETYARFGFNTAKEAAVNLDITLVKLGKEPQTLKRK